MMRGTKDLRVEGSELGLDVGGTGKHEGIRRMPRACDEMLMTGRGYGEEKREKSISARRKQILECGTWSE